MSKIGFVGLGIMGTPMAGHLHQGRARAVPLQHAEQFPPTLIAAGGKACASGKEVGAEGGHRLHDGARHARRRGGAVRRRTASPQGLPPGKIVVDMSSISPIETKEFAKKINALGCDYLDAPVSGGEVGAKNASAHDHGRRPRGGVRRA